jgi:hypothetical protein
VISKREEAGTVIKKKDMWNIPTIIGLESDGETITFYRYDCSRKES